VNDAPAPTLPLKKREEIAEEEEETARLMVVQKKCESNQNPPSLSLSL